MQYSGHGVGRHLFYGQNAKQGSYLRVSSHVAADVLERVRAFREWYFNCTRHDLQVTLQLPEPPGAEYFRDLTRGSRDAAANLRGRKTRPWHVTLRDEDGRGDTVYVGLPKSDVRGTVYDKHKESLESGTLWPEGSVRFEVRSRRDVAMGILKQLKDCEYVPGYTAGYVSAWFEARGVLLPVDVAAIQEVRAAPRTTDVARQCKWLRDGVAPTVRRLLLSGVPRDELMVYLGLRGA
jgi:DNA relaxase NicK